MEALSIAQMKELKSLGDTFGGKSMSWCSYDDRQEPFLVSNDGIYDIKQNSKFFLNDKYITYTADDLIRKIETLFKLYIYYNGEYYNVKIPNVIEHLEKSLLDTLFIIYKFLLTSGRFN